MCVRIFFSDVHVCVYVCVCVRACVYVCVHVCVCVDEIITAMESGQDCKDLLSQMSRGDVWNAVKHFHTALKYMNHFFKS